MTEMSQQIENMNGLIVYDRNVAANREWYIGKYIEEFAKKGISLKLAYTDELTTELMSGASGASGTKGAAGESCASGSGEGVSGIQATFSESTFAIMRDINPGLSANLEKLNMRVFNSATVSAICNDKYATYKYMEEKNLAPFMPMMLLTDYLGLEQKEFPIVLKSRAGHGGTEVFWVDNHLELQSIIKGEALACAPVDGEVTGASAGGDALACERLSDFLMQKPCDTPGIDVRVYVIGGEIVAAMKRINRSLGDIRDRFKSNYCLGGACEIYDFKSDVKMCDMVKKITKSLQLDFAGIDFIFHNGEPVFNEIEDVVGARMLYDHTDIDIVKQYVDYIVNEMG